MGRMAMAANMAKMRPVSTGWRLPQLDRIAVGIVDAGEAADAFLRFYLGNLDARGAKALNELIEAVGEIMSRGLTLQRRVHRQHDLVDPSFGDAADELVDGEVLGTHALER